MKKLGITAFNARVSPVFDASERLEVFEVNGDRLNPIGTALLGGGTLQGRIAQLREQGIDTLICGAITTYAQDLLIAAGIRVISWICGPVDDVLEAYLTNTLDASGWMMPGCDNRRSRRGRGRCRRARGHHGPSGPAGRWP